MKQLLITGANRGIGLEFTQQYLADGWHVYATYRTNSAAASQHSSSALAALACDQLTLLPLDVTEDASISTLQEQLSGIELDLIINNAGIFGPREQSLGTVSRQQWLEVLNVNSVAPLMLAQALHSNLIAKRGTFAVMSSRMGSIDDNGGGALYLYRSSKTAVNMVVKSLSIDLKDQGINVIALHPGWVRTDMGGPNGSIDTQTSVNGLRQVLDHITPADSGRFINYDGTSIAW
jgi:NAD(P)-dependent dehydrogenase (short-subunit alcohol dehydrogenase family)